MNLDALGDVQELVQKRLMDADGITDFFFDQIYDYLTREVEPELPNIKVSTGRDFKFLLKQFDEKLLNRGYTFNWEMHSNTLGFVPREYAHIERMTKFAFSKLGDTRVEGLFYFTVLCLIFYGGIRGVETDEYIDTFPLDVFDILKPYVVSKKLQMEFSNEEVKAASDEVDVEGLEAVDPSAIPPFAMKSVVMKDGNYYLVYDVLKGGTWR